VPSERKGIYETVQYRDRVAVTAVDASLLVESRASPPGWPPRPGWWPKFNFELRSPGSFTNQNLTAESQRHRENLQICKNQGFSHPL